MVTDVAAFLGPYPFRHVERGSPAWLLEQMDRLAIETAWVGYLPAFLYRDPAPGNRALERLVAGYPRLRPVPTVSAALPGWRDELRRAADGGVPAVRLYPQYATGDPPGDATVDVVLRAASLGLPVILTVRFEDARQGHPLDRGGDLPAAVVRALARSGPDVRLLVSHADRALVEEVHFGLTPAEARRVLWDIAWLWGPPEDHLSLLVATVGAERFTLGTGMPLRIPDATFARLELLPGDGGVRRGILDAHLERWRRGR